MFTFESGYFINRPQQEVFDFVTNPNNETKWRSSAVSLELASEGPIGVGTTMHTVDKFLGRKIKGTNEITSWDPPHQYGFKAVSGPIPFEVTIKFESKENGTQLTLAGEAEFGGFFKLAEGVAGKQLEKQLDTDFNALKVLLEGG